MEAENSAADIGVSRAWNDIEQGLTHGNHQQQHREEHGDARASLRAAVPELQNQAKATSKHRHALQQAKRAGNLAIEILEAHRRGEDARQREQHKTEDQPIERRGQG